MCFQTLVCIRTTKRVYLLKLQISRESTEMLFGNMHFSHFIPDDSESGWSRDLFGENINVNSNVGRGQENLIS